VNPPAARTAARGFTLLETLLALVLFALLAGAVYQVSSASVDASTIATSEAAASERLEAFLRATRNAFLNMPAKAAVSLRPDPSGSGAPDLVFTGTGTYFGTGELAGGALVVSARARSDGTRVIALRREPRAEAGFGRAGASGSWLPLLPRVERVRWDFFVDGQWREEGVDGRRPLLVRLRFSRAEDPQHPVEAVFWLPPLSGQPPVAEGTLIPQEAAPQP
jgi:prepilin-type N-terminal cleavage/methylation domain-containing protein